MRLQYLYLTLSFVLLIVFSSCKTNECICPDYYLPVCGSNNQTYPNSCEADCDNVTYIDGQCPVYGVGKIIYEGDTASGGCGFLIKILNEKFKPLDLAIDYQEPNLWVTLKYRILNTRYSCNSPIEQYFEIEVLEIQNL